MGDRVKVHYNGTLADGAVFDQTEEGAPLEFTLGAQEVIPGFEEAVVGMQPGETRTVTVPAAEAYGQHRPDLVAHVERERFPGNPAFEVGQQLQITQEDGSKLVADRHRRHPHHRRPRRQPPPGRQRPDLHHHAGHHHGRRLRAVTAPSSPQSQPVSSASMRL